MVELADTSDSKSDALRRESSNLSARSRKYQEPPRGLRWLTLILIISRYRLIG